MIRHLKMKKEYSTHIPMLIKAVQMTNGSVLELGAGLYSTPLLHWLCAESGRKLITYETDPGFFEWLKTYQSETHSIVDNLNLPESHWSVVFIDNGIDEREKCAIRFKDSADLIVLHDTESDLYGYKNVFPHFKFRYDWKFCKPWTTTLSNFIKL